MSHYAARMAPDHSPTRIDFSSSERSSLGIEWELELVDPDTRQLASRSDEILAAITPSGMKEHPKAKHELFQSCVEVITGVCGTVPEACADLGETLEEVSAAAADAGLRVMCSGTHPLTDWSSQRIVRELRPVVTTACADISALLGHTG